MTTRTIRTIRVSNGIETHSLEVLEDAGRFFLHDLKDVNSDSILEIQDDTDTSVADVIRDNGFEIVGS